MSKRSKTLSKLLALTLTTITPTLILGQSNDQVAEMINSTIEVPHLKVGDKVYYDVDLAYLGGLNLEITKFGGFLIEKRDTVAIFDGSSLLLKKLRAGNDTYVDLTMTYLGDTRFQLKDYSGPLPALSFELKEFSLIEPDEWKTNERVWDSSSENWAVTMHHPFLSDAPLMDVDRDGKKDILILGIQHDGQFTGLPIKVRWLRNLGNGEFAPGDDSIFPDSATRIHLWHSSVADYNGDGFDDLFIVNQGWDEDPWDGGPNLLLLSKAEGGFYDAGIDDENFDYRGTTHAMITGDLNNDGHLDIITADTGGLDVDDGRIKVLINDGLGNFTKNNSFQSTKDTERYWTNTSEMIGLVDANGDGFDDLLLGSWRGFKKDRIYENDGEGNFDFTKYTTLPELIDKSGRHIYTAYTMARLDLNFDGHEDLVLSKHEWYKYRAMQFLVNDGAGNFKDETEKYSPWAKEPTFDAEEKIPPWMEVIDINEDGYQDIRLIYENHGAPYWDHHYLWLRQPGGGFIEYPASQIGIDYSWFYTLDIDRDGDLDLVARRPKGGFIDDPSQPHLKSQKYEWKVLENKIFV